MVHHRFMYGSMTSVPTSALWTIGACPNHFSPEAIQSAFRLEHVPLVPYSVGHVTDHIRHACGSGAFTPGHRVSVIGGLRH